MEDNSFLFFSSLSEAHLSLRLVKAVSTEGTALAIASYSYGEQRELPPKIGRTTTSSLISLCADPVVPIVPLSLCLLPFSIS